MIILTMEQEAFLLEFLDNYIDTDTLINSLLNAKDNEDQNKFIDDLIIKIKTNPSIINYLINN